MKLSLLLYYLLTVTLFSIWTENLLLPHPVHTPTLSTESMREQCHSSSLNFGFQRPPYVYQLLGKAGDCRSTDGCGTTGAWRVTYQKVRTCSKNNRPFQKGRKANLKVLPLTNCGENWASNHNRNGLYPLNNSSIQEIRINVSTWNKQTKKKKKLVLITEKPPVQICTNHKGNNGIRKPLT